MNLINLYQELFIGAIIYSIFWFIFSRITKRNDIADIVWGLGFFLSTLYAYFSSPLDKVFDLRFIVLLLVAFWSLRLSIHIFSRNIKKKEDERYRNWKEEWGSWEAIRTFFQVFLLQTFLMLIVVSPAVFSVYLGVNLNIVSILGILIWLIGFYFESIADLQLKIFIEKKKSGEIDREVLDTGLWKYSRHPNYFGEVSQWWGIWIISLTSLYAFISILGPITITILIIFISGIPLLEKKMMQSEKYREYAKKTNSLIPWFPKATE